MLVFQGDEDLRPRMIELVLPTAVKVCAYPDTEHRRDGRVCVSMPLDDLQNLIALCRRIAQNGDDAPRGVVFGSDYRGGRFDVASATYDAPENELGLDCASFVMALFETVGFPLLDREKWPDRSLPQSWLQFLVGQVDDNRLKRIESRASALKTFSPTEVAGAALHDPPRVPFERAQSASAWLCERWQAVFSVGT